MLYQTHYKSPIGLLLLVGNDKSLLGVWVENQKYFLSNIKEALVVNDELLIFIKTKEWLARYFRKEDPLICELPLAPLGSEFRQSVWQILCGIPYGHVITYGEIAKRIAKDQNKKIVSAQAVGNAVAHNPISIIIPCHRVIGATGSLTGYAGGIKNKLTLLELEGVNTKQFTLPIKKEISMEKKQDKVRCSWVNPNNERYIAYHDQEWAIPTYDERVLLEFLILESFQAGLSWECILNKRECFSQAFDNFELDKICNYKNSKVEELLQNKGIVRNKLKIKATITNASIFKVIQKEKGSFANYLWSFTNGNIIYQVGEVTSPLSDEISADLKRRGMKFVGSTIIYSYLQAMGIINSHDKACFLYKENKKEGVTRPLS